LKTTITCLITACLLFMASSLWAIVPADDVIKNALADLERYEGQASSLSPGQSAGANRILKLLRLSRDRLDSSPNKTDPSWIAVDERYAILQSSLEEIVSPSQPATSSPAAASATPTTATPPPAATTATPAQATTASDVPELVSGQRVQVRKLARDIQNSRESISTSGPSAFQDPANVTARKERLDQYAAALARYPQVDDPDVQVAQSEYEALREALSAEYQRAQEQLSQLGDVQQSLATIENNFTDYPMPDALAVPFSEAQAQDWVTAAGKARTVAEHNLEQLAMIEPIAYLPNNPGTPQGGAPYDSDDVKRMQRNAQSILGNIQSTYESMAGDLENRMQSIENDTLTRWAIDPEQDENRWRFIGELQPDEAYGVFDEATETAMSARYLEAALGRDTSRADGVLAGIENARAKYDSDRALALETSALPEPKSTDRERLKIAEEILANPKYEFGEHGEIVLTTAEIIEREREDSEIEIDEAELTASGDIEMSGTETTWTYRWQEFKFAVPLREDDSDEWFIWWITAKNFSSGGARTPINRWVSGEANKGDRILESNL